MTYKKQENFNEIETVREILKNGFSKGIFNLKELCGLAKYYNSIGFEGKKLEKELLSFCETHVPNFSSVIYSGAIKKALASSKKYKLKESNPIIITESEWAKIVTVPIKYAKILFVMCVIAKHNDEYGILKEKTKKNKNFYCNYSMLDLLSMAKVRMNSSEMMNINNILDCQNGYITAFITDDDTKDATKTYTVNIVDNNSDVAIIVEDMNNIIDYFPYFCEKCGRIIERTGKRHKYCSGCWEERQKELWSTSSKKYYDKKKVLS